MYGDQQQINIQLPYPSKRGVLRLPTDEEVTTYLDSFKRGRKDDDFSADADLFSKIRIDKDGEPFDQYEASYVINHLLSQSVVNTEKNGDQYTVTMKTAFGNTVHVMRPPTLKELMNYRSGMVSSDGKANRSASVRLYDLLQEKAEGYADENAIPTLHKVSVVSEIYLTHANIDPIQIDAKN